MSIADNKYVQISGTPSAGQQEVSASVLNEELQVWSEYQQTDAQVLAAGVSTKITCDGVEYSNLLPSGGTVIWNTSTNEGALVSGAFYFLEFVITATATTNNTNLTLAIVDPASPSTIYYAQDFDFARSGSEELHPYVFTFFSQITGDIALYALADKNMTIDDITVVAKREI